LRQWQRNGEALLSALKKQTNYEKMNIHWLSKSILPFLTSSDERLFCNERQSAHSRRGLVLLSVPQKNQKGKTDKMLLFAQSLCAQSVRTMAAHLLPRLAAHPHASAIATMPFHHTAHHCSA
jgi:hypothetical protein